MRPAGNARLGKRFTMGHSARVFHPANPPRNNNKDLIDPGNHDAL